jgi:hypothetical protein
MPRRYQLEVEREGHGSMQRSGRWEFSVNQRIPVLFIGDLSEAAGGGGYLSLDTGLGVDGETTDFRLGWTIGLAGQVRLGESTRLLGLLGAGGDLDILDLPEDQRAVLGRRRAAIPSAHGEAILAVVVGEPDSLSLGIFGGFTARTGATRWYNDKADSSARFSEWGPMLGLTIAHRW